MKKFAALVAVLALICFAAPAFAANPFMDVPMNHWAYDAVSQLASRGVVSGYPDGAFKGEWKATRYEMASVVARALAYVDMNKASKQDLELLKKLVVEFKDELDALGVKVDELDSRVALLEEGVGGWKFWGEFRFDAKWADRNFDEDCDCDDTSTPYTDTGETDFTVSRYRIWMSKKVDDKVTFIARLGGADATFERYYLDVKLPWDATMWVGKWNFDWEAESGLYADNDAWFTDQTLQGFYFNKPFNMGDFSIFLAHREGTACCDDCDNPYDPKTEGYVYGARVDFHFNEQFRMAVQGIVQTYADATWSNWIDGSMGDWTTIWVDAGVKFTPDIELKGAYFWQQWECGSDGEEFDPNAWKVILDVKQEAFGFTSLWIEYASFDHRFKTVNAPYDEFVMGRDCDVCNSPNRSISHTLTNQGGLGGNYYDGGTALLVRLNQRWNDKWETFQRYVKFDLGAPIPNGWVGKFDYVQEWNIGVRYWYTPSLMFELSYSDFDKESNNLDCDNGWDTNMIRLRTYVSF